MNADIAGRPQLIKGNSQLLFAGMRRLSENSVISIKNKSFSVTAQVIVPESALEGVIIAQGGAFGGWAFYAKEGKTKFVYNVLGLREFVTEADAPSRRRAPGAGGVRLRRRRARQGRRRELFLDGEPVGQGSRRGHPADDLLRRRDDRHR